MEEKLSGNTPQLLRRMAIAIVATAIVAAPAAYARSSTNLILVPPTDLPEAARQAGEAMFLHEEVNGTTLLYIEQNGGARLTILDVTDPGHVKAEPSAQLDAPGPFDFVSTLGERAELVRFRQGQGNAVLDLHNATIPTLKGIQGLTLKGPTMPLGADAFAVTSQSDAAAPPTRDYQVVDAANSQDFNRVFDVKGVREEIANKNTGTTFLLTDSGLYLIRRPTMEMDAQRRELNDAN